MRTFWKDLRYGARMLLKNPGFTSIAVITLALGIGANAAIFSVVNAVLLRPLPFKEPERLIMIRETKIPQFPEFSVSPGNFLDWKRRNTVFERLVAVRTPSFNLIGTGDPEQLSGMRVTDGFFAMLGAKPELGREFRPEEDQPGRDNVVILSHGLWQRRFGGDPKIIDQTITLSGRIYTVIGVMPVTFSFGGSETALWAPMGFTPDDAQNHGGHFLSAIGQLKPGATIEQARSEMSAIAGQLAQEFPDANAGWNVKLLPLQEFIVRSVETALLVLLGAVAFVLLIACANVANLLLARAAGREKEIAIRTALGAGRARIVRQLLTESALLALTGGVAGLLLAKWGTDLLLKLAPQNLPRMSGVSLDGRVLAFTAAVTLLTGLIFGLVPALQASKPNLTETMKDAGGRGSTEGGRRQFVRGSLVVLEMASALLLLVGAGLLIKSFWRLQRIDPGFNANNALTASVTLPSRKYPEENQQSAFFQQLLEKVRALPGVQAAGASNVVPLGGDYVLGFVIEGRPPLPPGAGQSTNYYAVSADYFKAMGIPLLRGRVFTEQDTRNSTRVAVISDSMAKRMFPNEDPIGKRIHVTNGPTVFREIVGIVGDVKHYGLDQDTTLQTYEPYTQQPFSFMTLVVRTAGDPTNLTSAIRNQILSIDKEQPVSGIRTLEQRVSTSIAQQRFSMLLLGVFAAVAMVLAAVGIYGVLSYAAAQRTHEIGIRMALGARAGNVLKMVIGQGMKLALAGVALGSGAALALTQLMKRLLFGVTAADPMTYVVIALSLSLVALFACWIPARRAAKVDPMVALRVE
ncbi:MAG TPA: ABC transporter permease [Blastocatellia bacterium]|nr:ABC transporter permease [Blastocatellia bacterium]